MHLKSLEELILTSTISFSNLALVEGASGTSSLLNIFYSFYHYITGIEKKVLLVNEIEMVRRYIRLKQICNKQLDCEFINIDSTNDKEIMRNALINCIDEQISKEAELNHCKIKVNFFNCTKEIIEITFESEKQSYRIQQTWEYDDQSNNC